MILTQVFLPAVLGGVILGFPIALLLQLLGKKLGSFRPTFWSAYGAASLATSVSYILIKLSDFESIFAGLLVGLAVHTASILNFFRGTDGQRVDLGAAASIAGAQCLITASFLAVVATILLSFN